MDRDVFLGRKYVCVCRLLCHLLLLLEECVGFDGVRFHFIIILELDRGGYKYLGYRRGL